MAGDAGEVVQIITIVMVLNVCTAGQCAEPFVAGFDRFGRYGEIDEPTAGRLLLSELSCTACHAADDQTLEPGTGTATEWCRRALERELDA